MGSRDALAELDELLGEHGLLGIAYQHTRQRLQDNPRAVSRETWQPMLNASYRLLSLVTGLASGRPDAPTDMDPSGQYLPCEHCGRTTNMRAYGRPWHFLCWQMSGCPILEPADTQTPEEADSGSSGAEMDAEEPGEPSGAETPGGASAPDSEPFRRRKRQREQAGESDQQPYSVDPDEELAAFSAELRSAAERRQKPEPTDEECVAALQAWHEHVRVLDRPFQFGSAPGYTGILLYELLASARGAMVQPEPLVSEEVHAITGADTTLHTWSFLDPDTDLQPGMVITELDVTAQFLAAARSADCGDGEPELHTDAALLAEHLDTLVQRPGYLTLAATPDLSSLLPHARHTLAEIEEGWTLPMPVAKYLHKDRGIELVPQSAIIWPKGRRGKRLENWARHVDTARRGLEEAKAAGQPGAALALGVLKSMYATFLGGMLRSAQHNDRGTYRPDWSDMVTSTAGINALRAPNWDRAVPNLEPGVQLLGGLKDAFWLVSPPELAPVRPAELGYADQPGTHHNQAGKWHYNRSAVVTDEMCEAFADGRVGTMQRLIANAAE